MKRLIRRSRRSIEKANNLFSALLSRTREKQGYKSAPTSNLSFEPLENRVLLTTLVLPKGEQGELVYRYADPEQGDDGMNELRIGTLSGMGPEQDVVVEILALDTISNPEEWRTRGIGGLATFPDGTTQELDGGIVDEDQLINPIAASGLDFHATATDSVGNTFGITTNGFLYRMDTTGVFTTTVIGQVRDTNNPFASSITFTGFESADFAWADVDVDTDGDGFFDTTVFKEVIYAVVQAPWIDDNGIVSGQGATLISIDPLTGEAEPVGNVDGTSSYEASAIRSYDNDEETGEPLNPNITSIVFSEEVHNDSDNTREPVFIAYDSTSYRFLTLGVAESQFTGDASLNTEIMTNYDDGRDNEVWVTGMAYCDYDNDGNSDLFATTYSVSDDGERSDGKLVIVEFGLIVPGGLTGFQYVDVAEMGVHDEIDPDPPERYLESLTYDSVGQAAYSTETFPGLNTYQMILDGLIRTGDGFSSFTGDIYQMYVRQSTPDVYITLTYIDTEGVYQPQGGAPAFLYIDEDDSEIYTPDNAGGAAIGTRPVTHESDDIWFDGVTFYTDSSETAPVPDVDYSGVWENGEMRPGIIVEEGNDVGMISIGGPVFGDVVVRDGSIGTFYAGFLGTNEFVVNGDLQNLAVGTQAGGIAESDDSWQPALNSIYYDYGQGAIFDTTTTVLDVMGQMGSFQSNNDWGLPVRVWGNDDVASFPGVFEFLYSDSTDTENPDVQYYNTSREIERKSGDNVPGAVDFYSGSLDHIITNDTPETAQFLGTTSDGLIRVVGECEAGSYDPTDYYGFGALAGQDIEIKFFDTSQNINDTTGIPYDPGTQTVYTPGVGSVVVYDPNGELIAMSGEFDPVTFAYKPISFTTEIAGAYIVMVQDALSYYRLDIEGVSETALGGGTVSEDMRSVGYASGSSGIDTRPSVQVINGNLGVINVAGHIHNGQFKTNNGDILAIQALSTETVHEGLQGFVYGLTDSDAIYVGDEPYVVASGTIGEVRAAGSSDIEVYAGEDVQSVHCDADFAGSIYADGNIGSIYMAGNYGGITDGGTTWLNVTWAIANADGEGAPGIIDSIIIHGTNYADFSTGRNIDHNNPDILSGSGNVRYVYIGGGGTAPWSYNPGETVKVIDDSGAEVILSPGYEGVDVEVTTTVIVDGEEQEVIDIFNDGGVLSIELIPVYAILPGEVATLPPSQWPGAGNAIVSVASTDGLRISTSGDDPVEIGLVQVSGNIDNSVVISGKAPVSILRLEADMPTPVDDADANQDDVQDGTTENTTGYTGITSIVNNSGWWLDQYGNPYEKNSGINKTKWVGGDLLSIVVGEVALAEVIDPDSAIPSGSELSEDEAEALLTLTYDLSEVRIKGNLGFTENTTGQYIVAPLVYESNHQVVTTGGSMYNGMYSAAAIEQIDIAGKIDGNIYVASSVFNINTNSDNSDFEGQFDGVSAAIMIRGNLGRIDVGDGLEAPGTGEWAQAGIFVSNDIDFVLAQGYDHDIAGAVIASGDINRVSILDGADLEGYNFVGDWKCPSIGAYTGFEEFGIANNVYTYLAFDGDGGYALNEILIKGDDSEMVGAYIKTPNVNRITITGNAEGMKASYIEANVYGNDNAGLINQISVCGYGILDSTINAGYSLNKIDIKKGGNIENTNITSDWKIGTITADIISETNIFGGVNNINGIDKIIARDSIHDLTVSAGGLKTLAAKNDITGSSIWVEDELGQIKTGGDLISNIIVGGDYGYLKTVQVGGNLGTVGGGNISVEGQIGTIKVKGDFEADLYLNQSHQYYANSDFKGYELKSLTVGGILDLAGDIYGDIASIKGGGDFGKSGNELNIHGDLNKLLVGSGKTKAEILVDLNVDGDLGTVKTTGDIEGDITVVGDAKNISVSIAEKASSGTHGLNGDVTVGNDLGSITVKNGDLNGAINIEGKTKGAIKTVGCDLYGNAVIDGGYGLDITGSLESYYVSTGDIKQIVLRSHENEQGSLAEDGVILIDGDLDKLIVDDIIAGTIYVTGNVGTISATAIRGASIIVGGDIGKIEVATDVTDSVIVVGYDPGAGGIIDATDFAKIDGQGTDDTWMEEDFQGQSWAADYEAGWLAEDYSSAEVQAEICSVYEAYLMTKFTIEGDVVDSREVATSGNIKSVKIESLKYSSIAAGVSPGSDGMYGDLNGTDKAGDGLSTIESVTIGSHVGILEGGAYRPFGVFADGEIGKLKIGKTTVNVPAQPSGSSGFRAWEIIDIDEFDLVATPGTQLLSFEAGDSLEYPVGDGTVIFKMSGVGRGAVKFDTATGQVLAMQLKDTTAKTSVTVQAKNLDEELQIGRIFTGDDGSLKNLIVDGTLVYSEDGDSLNIGGNIGKLVLNGIDSTLDAYDSAMSLVVGGSIGNLIIVDDNTDEDDFDITADSDNIIEFNIQGSVSRAILGEVSTYAAIGIDSAKSVMVMGGFEGTLTADDNIDNVQIKGKYDGLIIVDGDIKKVAVGGAMGAKRTDNRAEATISASGNIKSFYAASMENASIVAGENLINVKVAGNVTRSDIVAGVILEDADDLRDSDIEVYRGDIVKVMIGGDFVESNIAAGVAPGADGLFSTGDDVLNTKIVEKFDAPQVESVSIDIDGGGTGFNTIRIKLVDNVQDKSSNIGSIAIKGIIEESGWTNFEYAIIAAGDVEKVVVHGERFAGDDNVNLQEVSAKQINAELINKDIRSLSDVADSAVWVQVDGLDQRFASTEQVFQQGVTDDIFVYGSGVSIKYDEATNTILFTDQSGLLENLEGANYYKIILNADAIQNKMGIKLDGEFTGELPSGDSQPGGDFVYTFAVADVGDLATTAFAPFDANDGFPQNYYWEYTSILGDNRSYTGGVSMLDNDFYTLNNLQEGQILSVQLSDMSIYDDAWYYLADWYDNIYVELLKVENHADYNDLGVTSTIAYNNYFDGVSVAPTVASEMSEVFFSGDSFYGYDDEGGNFFKINVESPDGLDGQTITTFEVLANDLIDVNSTIRTQGIFESLYAFGGHSGDSFWAVANYIPASGSSYHSLVQIQNIERDVEVNQSETLSVVVADSDSNLSSYGIVGLVEDKDYREGGVRDILYGVTADGTLYELDSDIYSNDFGSIIDQDVTDADPATPIGQIVDTDGNVITDLNITGISLSREGDGLLILHDLARGDYSSTRTDAIYKVTFNDADQPQAEYWLNPDPADYGQYDFAGLASSPDGYTLVGMPTYGSPKGDTFTITYANETTTHEFGGDDVATLQAGLLNVYSDLDNHPENKETFSFVQNDLYYGFTIDYNSALTGQLQVEIDDIDFWETVVINGQPQTMLAGSVVDWAYSDNQFVDVTVVNQPDVFGNVSSSLIVDIDATFAEGEADIYFSADSGNVWTMGQFSLDKVDELQGKDTREATSSMPQHDMIMPDITDLTVSPVILETTIRLEADDILDFNLRKYLSNYLYSQLEGELDVDLLIEIQNDLLDKGQGDLLAEFQASLVFTSYNALGYDPVQEVFALVSTDSYDAKPIMVEDPVTPEKGDVELTLDVLGQIYSNVTPSVVSTEGVTQLTITDIKGIEFGEVKDINAPDGSADTVERPELWAIVEVTSTFDPFGSGNIEVVSTDHLIKLEDILYPGDNMITSDWTMAGFDLDNVSELAFGSFPSTGQNPVLSEDKNELFGFDTVTNTLVRFDTREVKIDTESNDVIVNVDFGRPEIIGAIDSDFEITAMDFDSKTRLLAVENNGNSIIQIDTAINAGADRTKTIELLEDGEYSVLTFDSTLDDSEPILIRQVQGSPAGDSDGMFIRLNDGDWEVHDFGQAAATDLGTVQVSSSGNTTMANGYYKLDVSYTTGQGDITLVFDDIDWSVLGDVDSVKIDDTSNAAILDYDDNSITISIDTDSGNGSLDLYFGSTVDILRPGLGYTITTPVDAQITLGLDGTIDLVANIEEDGNYVLRVGPTFNVSSLFYSFFGFNLVASEPIKYDLDIFAFNDGDSDFGITVTDSGLTYDSSAPNDTAVDLMASSFGSEWIADERRYDEDSDDNLYIFNRNEIAGSTDWSMRAEGKLLTANEAGHIEITSELAMLQDIDVYKVELAEGQKMQIDVDSLKYTGGNDVEFMVGVYNGDLEAIATVYTDSTDAVTPAEMVDPDYVVQAINTLGIEGYEEQILDFMTLTDLDGDGVDETLVGTYYVVVSMFVNSTSDGFVDTNNYGSVNPYTLSVTTIEGGSQEIEYSDGPQLVYLAFGDKDKTDGGVNIDAEYLIESMIGSGAIPYEDVYKRDAFSLSDFEGVPEYFMDDVDGDGLTDDRIDVTWDYMVARMAVEVESVYREALDNPLTEEREDLKLIQFVTDIDVHVDRDGDGLEDFPESQVLSIKDFNISRMEHCSVVIGGSYPLLGLAGIAETVDRHNDDRTDMCTVGSASIGDFTNLFLDGTDKENVDMIVNRVSGTAIHELGHILGLEHSTEVNPDLTYPVGSAAVYEPDNVMNYNVTAVRLAGAKFEERNKMADSDYFSYIIPQLGFQNEIDSLLRNLGTRTPSLGEGMN